MTPITGFMKLPYHLILTLEWYETNLQLYTCVFWVKTVTDLLMFSPK